MSNKNPFGLPQIKIKPIDLGLGRPERDKDSRRTFTRTQKNEIWAQQNGKCANCHKRLDPRTVEYDHIRPWADKGKTIKENGAALCAECHKLKTHKDRLDNIEKESKRKGHGLF